MKQILQQTGLMCLVGLALCSEVRAVEKSSTYIRWSGEYRLRGLYQDNFQAVDSEARDFFNTRFILEGDFAPNDTLEAHFAVNMASDLGGEKRGQDGIVNENLDDFRAQLLEAYADWNLGSGFFLNLGRFRMDWGNQAVVSSNWDDLRPYNFDGLITGYDAKSFKFEAGVLRVGDWRATGNVEDPEEDHYFFNLKLRSLSAALEETQVFFLRSQSDNYNVPSTNFSLPGASINKIGLSLKGAYSRLEYHFDYVNQSGKLNDATSLSAWMIDMKLGARLFQSKKAVVYWVFHYDTGDDQIGDEANETYRPLYYNHFVNGGLMNLFSWGNITYLGMGIDYEFSEFSSLKLQVLAFEISNDTSGPRDISYLGYGSAASFVSQAMAENQNAVKEVDLGTEIDVMYTKKFLSSAYIEFVAGAFLPGAYTEAYGFKKNIYSFRLSTGFEF